MGKLAVRTSAREKRSYTSPIRRNKNRAGIIESSVKICGECGEEFCAGESCGDILYDSFIRVTVIPQQSKITVSADTAAILAGMDKSNKKGKKKSSKNKSQRRNAKLLVRRKARKSGTSPSEAQNKASKNSKENYKEGEENVKQKYKRKCTKYSKKVHFSTK